jgi:cystathionine gamma-synthase
VKAQLRKRVADEIGAPADNVWLFPCGMAAIYMLHSAIVELFPNRRCVQFGFPYVDTLKVQQKFGAGTHFLPNGDATDVMRLAEIAASEPIAALYTEFPSNPLLRSPDLARLAELSRRHGFPLLVDDTIAGFRNVDVLPLVDAVTSSLTKFFSGAGDVTAGSLVLNPQGQHYDRLAEWLHRHYEDLVWEADAVVLAQNSVDYAERMREINRNAERLADFLRGHPRIERIYYPKFESPAEYRACLKPNGGYSGLLSIDLIDSARNAPRGYDRLRISKGPNLGTNFTLACPYTILAHYQELDWAESCGVSRYLIRVSVGREDADDLIARFEEALSE